MSKKSSKTTTKIHDSGSTPMNNEPLEMIKQNSHYTPEDQPKPLNEIFWNGKSNPLSSKGN